MSSYQYRKSHSGDKTVVRSSYLHNGISYTGKMTSLNWFSPMVTFPNEFPRGYKLADGVSIVTDMQYNVFYKLYDAFLSLIRSRHIITITNYTTEWGMLFASAKMRRHGNLFGEPARCSETTPELNWNRTHVCSIGWIPDLFWCVMACRQMIYGESFL